MGRKSTLTESQWNEIQERLLRGESGRSLAKEFGVSEAAIRKRIGAQTKKIKNVANQIVTAEQAFKALPIGAQISTRTLVDELRDISSHLSGAAKYGAATAHRLSGIAHAKVQEIDDASPLDDKSRLALSDISVLTKMANASSEIGLNLLNANKDMIAEANKPKTKAISGFEVVEYDDNGTEV